MKKLCYKACLRLLESYTAVEMAGFDVAPSFVLNELYYENVAQELE